MTALISVRDLHVYLGEAHVLQGIEFDVPELVELIGSVHAGEGKTVLMVEHHMEVVTGLAQRIAVLHHGSLLAVDTPEAIMSNRTVQQAYLGEPL